MQFALHTFKRKSVALGYRFKKFIKKYVDSIYYSIWRKQLSPFDCSAVLVIVTTCPVVTCILAKLAVYNNVINVSHP